MEFKLGLGPMSELIVNSLVNFSIDLQKPLMLIASRNQIDWDSGYVMKTPALSKQLAKFTSPYIKVCRDHCGPYFLDSEKNLSLKDALRATKKTIASDIENGFHLIHIDTSRCQDEYTIADELIQFCLNLNPAIEFEFGTEENIGVAASVLKYQQDVKFAKQYPNMKFVVAQTGSLVMEDRQIGSFDTSMVKKLAAYADSAGVRLKEHNADYLNDQQIAMRKQAGVHAMNIAPQLGVVKTKSILKMATHWGIDATDWKNTVLQSHKWKKWHIDGDNELKVLVAGHYCYGNTEFQKLVADLEKVLDWRSQINQDITDVLRTYYDNIY